MTQDPFIRRNPGPPGVKTGFVSLPSLNGSFLEAKDPFVILETARWDSENRFSRLFFDPLEILTTNDPERVPEVLARAGELSRKLHVAGFVSYEAGYRFQGLEYAGDTGPDPLVWFGCFAEPVVFDHATGRFVTRVPDGLLSGAPEEESGREDAGIEDVMLGMDRTEYVEKVGSIREYLARGESYQVNFTTRCSFRSALTPKELYRRLKGRQHVSYNGWIRRGDSHILSFSPELFFSRDGDRIVCRPMKGTLARGRTEQEDRERAEFLRRDQKNRSENVMIVDLIRNDLGTISRLGSVRVDELLRVERYETLFQMTSTVSARLLPGTGTDRIFASLFPSGSVTGAPRRSTMGIIRSLEEGARGVYTGALGFLAPGDRAVFNIPIRTVRFRGDRGVMGVGSGIVYDSDPQEEYGECVLKLRFLTDRPRSFSLLETLRWENGYLYLEEHLDRLLRSASYFDFPAPMESVRALLREREGEFRAGGEPVRVRLSLDERGRVDVTFSRENLRWPGPLRVSLSETPVSSSSPFLFHKTTLRELYETERSKAFERGFHEVVFQNEKGEITEGSFSNLLVLLRGEYLTPPVECGLLDGIYRGKLLEGSVPLHRPVRERRLSVQDLLDADEIRLVNSVRGESPVAVLEVTGEKGPLIREF